MENTEHPTSIPALDSFIDDAVPVTEPGDITSLEFQTRLSVGDKLLLDSKTLQIRVDPRRERREALRGDA